MSAFFRVPLDGELREVEITREGELVFPGYDWEQDDLMAFMTGQKSNKRELVDLWNNDPFRIIFGYPNYGLSGEVLFRFCLDIVKHVIPIYQLQYGEGDSEAIICDEIEKWIDDGMSENLTDLQERLVDTIDALIAGVDADRVRRTYRSFAEAEASIRALFAMRSLVYLMTYANDMPFNKIRRDMRHISDSALGAVEHRAMHEEIMRLGSLNPESGDRIQVHIVAERHWQIARFVYAINVLEETGKWPPMDGVKTWA